MNRDELHSRIVAGTANDAELEEYFGADLINEGVWALRTDPARRQDFLDWYHAVLEPIGIDSRIGLELFSGRTTIDQFVGTLDDETLQRFVAMFPGLQAEHQARLEREGRV